MNASAATAATRGRGAGRTAIPGAEREGRRAAKAAVGGYVPSTCRKPGWQAGHAVRAAARSCVHTNTHMVVHPPPQYTTPNTKKITNAQSRDFFKQIQIFVILHILEFGLCIQMEALKIFTYAILKVKKKMQFLKF